MKWQITKQFDFCYGHRVWSQELNQEFSLDGCLMCRHLHGHQGTILIHLESQNLHNGMVTDFKHLNWFKSFLDETLDHKFIIDINDPLFETLLPHFKDKKNLIEHPQGYKTVDFAVLHNEPLHLHEMYQGYVIVDFVPTSEQISAWLLGIIAKKMEPLDVKVSHVEFFETPKSKSTVYA
ncbi:MAG: 6-carboxytetrahydropterin synthase [Sulfurimonadaceae bacterium]|jgi:6-pyruvoyltetrahydropterin/6-carboxytetrahydropterin synthase|nr:6-carboxytetrahydropterin synthase [Arcobacteraceae bacterium]MDX9795273.1 6-carboxytetrahydropterin synthase [Arcobacteraceae bacterium]